MNKFLFYKLLSIIKLVECIVNPYEESARLVIYLQKPNDLGPRTWEAGVRCIENITQILFNRTEGKLTRAPNLVITVVSNMSNPAAQIQEEYLRKMMNSLAASEADVSVNNTTFYQFRIISDQKELIRNALEDSQVIQSDYYVIVVDNIAKFKNLMKNYVKPMISWNPGARFLILYNNRNERENKTSNAEKIFGELLFVHNVHKAGLLYSTSAVDYSLLTMDYYNSDACQSLKIREFAQCHNGRMEGKSIKTLKVELDKLFNIDRLSTCTFNVCASIWPPFVESDCVLGLELRLIDVIREHLDFQININCSYTSRGVEKSGTWTGLLGEVLDGDCDFIVGGFYPDNEVIEAFWASETYFDESYTWFVATADPKPPWMALYSIFETYTWLAVIAMLLVTWLVWFLLVNALPEPEGTGEFSLTGLNSLGVTICCSVDERPICKASRIYFYFLAIYGLLLTSMYTSKLITVLKDPGSLPQISTLEQVIKAGIPYGGSEEYRDWFQKDDEWISEKYNDSFDFKANDENLVYVARGDRVILSSRIYILQSNLSDNIYPFKTNVFRSPMQMIMKRGFALLSDFNRLLGRIRESGLFAKIEAQFLYNNTYLNRIAKMRKDESDTAIVLTTEHLQGPFAILMIGVCTSVFVFTIELFTYYVIQPCCSNYCKCCGKTSKKQKRRIKPNRTSIAKQGRKERKRDKTQNRKTKQERNNQQELNGREFISEEHEKILRAWRDATKYDTQIQRGIRFTPLKRRKITVTPEKLE